MTYNDMLNLVLALPFDTMKEVYSNGKQSLLIYRPSTLSKRFKNYDINTNFQIFLKIGDDKPFKPNHLRLLIDLKLRADSPPSRCNHRLQGRSRLLQQPRSSSGSVLFSWLKPPLQPCASCSWLQKPRTAGRSAQ